MLFDEFVRLHERYMMTVAMDILHNYHDAEDALCDAFAEVAADFRHVAKYPVDKQRDRLFEATRRCAVDILNKRNEIVRHEMLVPDYETVISPETHSYVMTLFEDEHDSLSCLSQKENELLTMHFLEGLSVPAISKLKKTRIDKIRKQIKKAVSKLEHANTQKLRGGGNDL